MPPKRPHAPLARDPRPIKRAKLDAVDARILDPSAVPSANGVAGRPTAYVGTRLMILKGEQLQSRVATLRDVADGLGWSVRLDPEPAPAKGLVLGVRTVTIAQADPLADRPPDAWYLLQRTRAVHGADALVGVGLDHVVSTADLEPQGWQLPHAPDPAGWQLPHDAPTAAGWQLPHPDLGPTVSSGLETYGLAGSGGRQPVTYLGPRPLRFADGDIKGRRPVVAILDTGCFAEHFWFGGGVVDTTVELDGHPIGFRDAASDLDTLGDVAGPFDGSVDRIAGHGTFIAGLVHQACPDATIVAWRAIPGGRPMVESEWITALAQIAELNRRARHGEDGGQFVDVLNLSMGYYHENEADELLDPILLQIVEELGRNGTVVVCSAGNDSTDRPCFPAAFTPWADGNGPVQARRNVVPVVSVGATNPNRTDALFTNAGNWVRCYVPAASVLSTMPPFQGGLEPVARTVVSGRQRESIDPDDYRGGFAVWSGTSFAAPTVAGALAAAMSPELFRARHSDTVTASVRRAWRAVERIAEIEQPK